MAASAKGKSVNEPMQPSIEMRRRQEGGVDVLWIETMSSQEELSAAVEGAASAGLPIVTTTEEG